MANHPKRTQRNEPMKNRSKYTARFVIGFGFASDWLSRLRQFFKPITERSKWKPKQFWIIFDTQ